MDIDEINIAVASGVKAGVKAALEEELRPFYIDQETHYKQHEFLGQMIDYSKTCKNVVLKTIIATVAVGVFSYMCIGFLFKHGWK